MENCLKKLLNAFGVSGEENEVLDVIKKELEGINCNIKEDNIGNLIVKVGEGSEKIMLCANMDNIGFIVNSIEDNFVRVSKIGEFDEKGFNNSLVKSNSGVIGRTILLNEGNLFIDFCMESEKDIREYIAEGDKLFFLCNTFDIKNNIISGGLNNRIGCYILLQVIKNIKKLNKEVYFVFTAQRELGGRGARAAAFEIKPDKCIVIDIEEASDIPGGKGKIKLGCGPVLRIMDRSMIISNNLKKDIQNIASKNNINLQYSCMGNFSEGGTVHKEVGGIDTAVISIPCRYGHTVSEITNKKDVDSAIELIEAYLKEL